MKLEPDGGIVVTGGAEGAKDAGQAVFALTKHQHGLGEAGEQLVGGEGGEQAADHEQRAARGGERSEGRREDRRVGEAAQRRREPHHVEAR